MSPVWWEYAVFGFVVRVLGGAAALLLLGFAAYGLLRGYLKLTDRWRTINALFWLYFGHCKGDRERLWRAVEKWHAWQTDVERERAVEAARQSAREYWEMREDGLRTIYNLPPRDLSPPPIDEDDE